MARNICIICDTFGFLARLYFCLGGFDGGRTCKILSGSQRFEEEYSEKTSTQSNEKTLRI
jgi:hypothetical protein